MKAAKHKDAPVDTHWRKHMHSLPNPEIPTPVWIQWLMPSLWHFINFLSGIMVVFVGGPMVGLISGMGPDHTGVQTTYVFLGIILNLSLGLLRYYLNRWRRLSSVNFRVQFYTFTMPSWFICFFYIWRFGDYVLS